MSPPDPAVTTQAILGWSEYYNGKWQSPKTSEVDLPSDIHSSSTAFIRRNLTLGVSYDELQEWLRVSILYQGSPRTSFVLYNHAQLTGPLRPTRQIMKGFSVGSGTNRTAGSIRATPTRKRSLISPMRPWTPVRREGGRAGGR
jgi:hypothetical protein